MQLEAGVSDGRNPKRNAWPRARILFLFAVFLSAVLVASLRPGSPVAASQMSAIVQPGACPPRAPSHVPKNAWAPAREQLAPKGAVALRLCRYLGLNTPHPLALARSRLVTQQPLIAHLVGELDTLPPYPKGVAFSCPAGDGSQVLALLAYPHDQRVTVAVEETGCENATNGDVGRLASGYHDMPTAGRLQTELRKLTTPASGNAR